MEQFQLIIDVEPAADRYRAYITLWDGRLLERFQDTPEAAALDLGRAVSEAMQASGLPATRLQAFTRIPENDDT
jgi:hypothetical protein